VCSWFNITKNSSKLASTTQQCPAHHKAVGSHARTVAPFLPTFSVDYSSLHKKRAQKTSSNVHKKLLQEHNLSTGARRLCNSSSTQHVSRLKMYVTEGP
jgi:hypothetical protein